MRHPKTLFFLYILTLTWGTGFAQQDDSYETLWKNVEELENDALTQSALKVVDVIAAKAEKEGNSAQTVRALLYTSKYALILEEDAPLKIVNDFQSAISEAEFPTKNILESYLAQLYWQYFQQNRYQFYNRTPTESKVDSTDFRTWDLTTLFHEIDGHFEASLENKEGLQKTALENFGPILVERSGSNVYRPSLFDLLAHEALKFYKTDENGITRPADRFEIDGPEVLCEADAFAQLDIDTQDDTSLQARALQVYQDLIAFHLSDTDNHALVAIDIERLDFIHQNAVFTERDERYIEVLRNSAESLGENPLSGLYDYEIAQTFHRQGNTYRPRTDEDNRWKQKEALALCDSVIATFPNSRGAKKCQSLKSQILAPSLQLTTEKFLSAATDARLLAEYKNIEKLELRALRISQKELEKLNNLYPSSKQLDFIQKLPVAKKWDASLKNEKDYQRHGIEILLPALDQGQYVILATPTLEKEQQKGSGPEGDGQNGGEIESNGSNGNGTFAFSTVQVTDLALVTTRSPGNHRFQVIDRHDGHPVPGAAVELSYRKNYDGKRLTSTRKTDAQGSVDIVMTDQNWSDVQVTVIQKDKKAHFGPFYVSRNYDQVEPSNVTTSAFLFTDRSIYRPSQSLYFKGIVVEISEDETSVVADEKVFVTLNDANGQEISKHDFATNEFGSVAGEFVLPNNGLTGQYSLEIQGSRGQFRQTHYFSVEEYKRPKFETTFEPIRESFRVNDSIAVQGTAAAYAGSAVTDAKVSYRVERAVDSPRWYYWHHPYYNRTPQEIAHGETVTDASGHFEIDFKALPDTSASEENLPIFRYEVTADVTDINGETRSATTTVSVGYHALTATIAVPNRLDKDKPSDTLTIDTKNLNGQPVSTQGTLKMYKLRAPEQVLRPRPWEAPDYDNWGKKDFKDKFPHDAFAQEDDPEAREKGELLWETDFSTEARGNQKSYDNDSSLEDGDSNTAMKTPVQMPDFEKWDSGKYVIELETQDKFGRTVKEAVQTTLYSENDKRPADNELFQIRTDKTSYTVGEQVKVTLSSAAKGLSVSVFVEKDHQIVDTKIIKLNDNSKTLSVPVTSDDLGGFAINYSFSAYNSFRSGSVAVVVPYPESDLKIETLSFRDKLRPGTEESWAFKIKGAKGDKVSSELLASMYDASLDAFMPHAWEFNPLMQSTYSSNIYSDAGQSFGVEEFRTYLDFETYYFRAQSYHRLDWFGLSFDYSQFAMRRTKSGQSLSYAEASMSMAADAESLNEVVITGAGVKENEPSDVESAKDYSNQETTFDGVQIRKNLQETAFFFPQLTTDEEGHVSFNFTTPEALTRWKLQLLAHTKNLESKVSTMEAVTQKELMVIPNAPRFLREGDEISISTKIANLTDKALSGQAILELTDAVSGEDISMDLLVVSKEDKNALREVSNEKGGNKNKKRNGAETSSSRSNGSGKATETSTANGNGTGTGTGRKNFKVDSLGNTRVSWRLKIPSGLQAVQYKVIAKAGDFSDGEQSLLPVLTNRKLVTETLPMWVRGGQTKTFTLNKLKENTSKTLGNHRLTFEITSNPAWYAVQALPYLMEYPFECNEQTFARYYANALASHIANSNPRIREVFDQWANSDALVSNLEKNKELKSIVIEETPWLRDAQSETEQKKRIALLFNMNKMRAERAGALNKLGNNQKSSGAWSWFTGGPDNRYITQHIVTGLGHLKRLKVVPGAVEGPTDETGSMVQNAFAYLDAEFVNEYEQIKKDASDLDENHLSAIQIHYLYMRSFFPDIKTSQKVDEVTSYYQQQARNYWTETGLLSKGMLALAMHRAGDSATAQKILTSLKENSITSEELGMYWKENGASWHWNQAPIETQALMIEAFGEIDNDTDTGNATVNERRGGDRNNMETIDNLKIWLLKNKQTNQWPTTKATTEAVYALLLRGSDWLSVTEAIEVLVGGAQVGPPEATGPVEKGNRPKDSASSENTNIEVGTGYYKTSWNADEISPEMAEVQLTKNGDGIAWGALYWQYFEDLDKITSAETPLKLKKGLFLKKNTDTGETISEITPNTELKVGDLVRVRIELQSDRDMEFLHMKDLRAAGFEPINVLSSYKWQDGLGYYESTQDASTNFFFDFLPKGIYVFEYDLRVNNVGEFSNGVTTIQSMYAPEFGSHSKGIRVNVGGAN